MNVNRNYELYKFVRMLTQIQENLMTEKLINLVFIQNKFIKDKLGESSNR